MKHLSNFTLSIVIVLTMLYGCEPTKPVNITSKISATDPFSETISKSQYFDISLNSDTVIEGKNGTVIVFPTGSVVDEDGAVVTKDIQVELAEAYSVEEMLLSNLMTTSNGELLETDGMFYLNLTQKGKQLFIDTDNPIRIEIPTQNKKQGMSIYEGIRDENGNMNWVNPVKVESYLEIVDFDALNFLPKNFAQSVAKGIPYKNHQSVTDELVDSLYYSLSKWGFLGNSVYINTNYNEAYDNPNSKVVNGKYVDGSYVVSEKAIDSATESTAEFSGEGIDPAMVKSIQNEEFQNTFLATREFEIRLQAIFRTCDNCVLDLYIHNVDMNLWEVDLKAANLLEGDLKSEFLNFSEQKLTNVKDGGKNVESLRKYYAKRLKRVNSELDKLKKKSVKQLEKKNAEVKKMAKKYKKLLQKRENFRMETYGFEWTKTGWANVDRGTIPKTWGREELEVEVVDGKQYDQVYTYVIYTSIKSLYRLNTKNNEQFYVGNETDKNMLMPKKEKAVLVTIAYKGKDPFTGVKEFTTGVDFNVKVNLNATTIAKFKEVLKPYDQYLKKNKIEEDLIYMDFFYKEKKRQEKLKKESAFLNSLYLVAHPCMIEGIIADSAVAW